MPQYCTVFHVFGAVRDVGPVGDPILALAGLPAGSAQPTSGPQRSGESVFESAAGGLVGRLVDGLGAHPHLWIVGETESESARDLLGEWRSVRDFSTVSRSDGLVASLDGLGREARW